MALRGPFSFKDAGGGQGVEGGGTSGNRHAVSSDAPGQAPKRGSVLGRGLVWSWSNALVGVIYAVPAIAALPFDVRRGLALGFGVLPAAIAGVAPARRDRWRVVVLGACTAVPMVVGSVLANDPVFAVAAIWVLCIAAALLAGRRPAGQIVMNLSVPMVGIGLSFESASESAALAGLIIVGSVYAWLVSLLWPDQPRPSAASRPRPPEPMLGYGVRLGAAGASAAAVGFAFDFDHVGWACAATLLVMRPSVEMQRLRSVGRVVSVCCGALAALVIAQLEPAAGWYAVVVLVAVGGAAAMRASRWYVTAAFTTLLVISLLLYAHPDDAGSRFGERVGETILGVSIAYVFGLLLPRLTTGWRRRESV